jgi:CRISPR/Cas system-associated exonuclease Cas4 (RecB family)
MILLAVAALLLLLGLALLRRSHGRRQELGLPGGDVFYQDHSGQPMAAVPLRSRIYGISGKPDCLIRNSDGIIPVELKNSARPPANDGVYPNHLIQVLAYIVLVRENYKEPVPYGLVIYSGETARKVVPTQENLAWFASVVNEVRAMRTAGSANRSHNQKGRCRGCGVHGSCDQSLWRSEVSRSA